NADFSHADRIVIRGRARFPTPLTIDPPSSGMHVIVDGPGWFGLHLTLLAGPPVAPGMPGWTVGRNGSFLYSPGPGLQAEVRVSPRTPGQLKVVLKVTGQGLVGGPAPGTPVYLRIALAMTEAVTERCAEVTFAGPHPNPVCTLLHTKLSCR